ncbi:hypothetical protein BVRB_6g128890 [Beta vulgaris subsp. vulgaris]|nr:hypothetical protein BVRB_6g128890 [Beta vulgaris subsp. vulgaris]
MKEDNRQLRVSERPFTKKKRENLTICCEYVWTNQYPSFSSPFNSTILPINQLSTSIFFSLLTSNLSLAQLIT